MFNSLFSNETFVKKSYMFIVVVTAFAVNAWAGTISYSVPVLTVRSDEQKVVADSGRLSRCPFSFVATTNAAPVKVSVIEDMPSGAGESLRSSLWLAVTTASLNLNRSLSGVIVSFETSGYVDGPSAGSMFCLAVMSAIEGRNFPGDFAMTGTIIADGTIGPVGGIAEKMKAAAKAGIKRVCIPSFARMDEDWNDLLDLGKELHLEVHQVSTIAEAYAVLHKLPAKQIERINPIEMCQLTSGAESVFKDNFVDFCKQLPKDKANWNKTTYRAFGEYQVGYFGAAAMDLTDALYEYSFENIDAEKIIAEEYPVLAQHLPTNTTSFIGKLVRNTPSKEQYVEALQALHTQLKNLHGSTADDENLEAIEQSETSGCDDSGENKPDDWLDDYVKSPCGDQFAPFANSWFVAIAFFEDIAKTIAYQIDVIKQSDAVEDWSDLDAAILNEIRDRLSGELTCKLINAHLMKEGRNGTTDKIYQGLVGTIPYVRPNGDVEKIEHIFYRTLKSMADSMKNDSVESEPTIQDHAYNASLRIADLTHNDIETTGNVLWAIFSEAQALSEACARSICRTVDIEGGMSGNTAYYNAVVSTARENALENIAMCRRSGIPCVMPVVSFQQAETRRDAYSSGDDASDMHIEVLENYLSASLYAKALMLCFSGQKPELNEKGYCSRDIKIAKLEPGVSVTTVSYLGINGEPIARDGFYGRRTICKDDETIITRTDARGLDVRTITTNECWLSKYDDDMHLLSRTYCNDKWEPKPRKDGVLIESFQYDKEGNKTQCEFLGVNSNRVNCVNGMAMIKYHYNKLGQEVRRRYYDTFGLCVNHQDGNAGFDAVYDKDGRLRKFTYVDKTEKPVMASGGYATETRRYSNGYEIERAWYDAKGNPISVNSAAKVKFEYDNDGNLIRRRYFDLNNHEVAIEGND